MGIKDFFMKKVLEKQLKDLPADQRDKLIEVISANPEFFQKIAEEVKQKQKEGKDQIAATMEVMRKHQGELQKLMGPMR
jgi:hypothetical protein